MHNDDIRPALQAPSFARRTRITRPLNIDDIELASSAGLSAPPAAPHPRPAAGGGPLAGDARRTQQLGASDLPEEPQHPRVLRPIQIILEPSYVPMAPSRPETLEAFMPAGEIYLRPWRGEVRQIRISEANAIWVHGLALHAMGAPPTATPTTNLGVVPMTLIVRYEGFAHRWTVEGPGRSQIDALIRALIDLTGYNISYE